MREMHAELRPQPNKRDMIRHHNGEDYFASLARQSCFIFLMCLKGLKIRDSEIAAVV